MGILYSKYVEYKSVATQTTFSGGGSRRYSIGPEINDSGVGQFHFDPTLMEEPLNEESFLEHFRKVPPIYRVVLTGGPCAGKSTMLAFLQTKIPQRAGLKVFCVPEAATLLVGGGLEWTDMNRERVIEYQLALLRTQMALENNFYQVARACGKPCLVVCDRGTMDGRAYCSEEDFNEILRRGGYTLEQLRDERYDAVVHMVSAAIGAEDFYNYDNPARFETVEAAKVADEHLRKMYLGHPKLRVFDNSTNFDRKLERVLDFIGDVIGSKFTHRTRRYLVTNHPDESSFPVAFARVTVTVTILNHSTEQDVHSIMKRQQGSATVYFYQSIKTQGRQERTRVEHRISGREYASLLCQRDLSRVEIVKENYSFLWKENYCELAMYSKPAYCVGKGVMYVESESKPELPPFVTIVRDITKDSAFSSYYISKFNSWEEVTRHESSGELLEDQI